MKKLPFILIGLFFATNAFAIDVSIVSLIASQNSSGYVCEGSSIGCSSFNAIYRVEKRGDNLYICEGGSLGECKPLSDIYKITRDRDNRIFMCSPSTIGNCSTFSALYKMNSNSLNKDVTLVCPGNTIGNCSTLSASYKINNSAFNKDITLVCPGNTIGNCSTINNLYSFRKDELRQDSDFSAKHSTSSVSANNELLKLTQQKQRASAFKERITRLIELTERAGKDDLVMVLQDLLVDVNNISQEVERKIDIQNRNKEREKEELKKVAEREEDRLKAINDAVEEDNRRAKEEIEKREYAARIMNMIRSKISETEGKINETDKSMEKHKSQLPNCGIYASNFGCRPTTMCSLYCTNEQKRVGDAYVRAYNELVPIYNNLLKERQKMIEVMYKLDDYFSHGVFLSASDRSYLLSLGINFNQ